MLSDDEIRDFAIKTKIDRAFWMVTGSPINKFARAIEAAVLAKLQAQATYGWLIACDEELVSAHLGVAELSHSYETAKKKLSELIQWHVAVATDPAVNGGFSLQLMQAQSEPVAEVQEVWKDPSKATVIVVFGKSLTNGDLLYTHPAPARHEPKPDVVHCIHVEQSTLGTHCGVALTNGAFSRNLSLTFDGETGKLIKAEVL